MDDLRKQSDKELKNIEDEIERIYKDAEGDLREKWTAYMDRAEKRVASYGKAYSDAVKSGDADAIAAAKAALNKKIESVTIRDKQFADMVDAVTDRMANVNQLAADYVNGQMPRMYSYNYNGSLREVQKDADAAGISGIAFNMIDDATVERMQKRGEVTLPKRKIDVPKDKQWNRKAINAQIMQGIIQGESIPQMSKRLREVTDMNKNSSIRNARTLTTEAENGGRLDSMKEAEDMGLEYEKTWVSTHDERTRLSHALMDGETVGLDEPFSNGLMYPADPSGAPEEVYNCRCSLVRKLVGFKGKHIDAAGYEPTYFADAQQAAAENPPTETELNETAEAFTEEQATETAAEEERVFVPAETIEEAERFAEDNFIQSGFVMYNYTGQKVSFKNIDLEQANAINKQLDKLFAEYNIDGLSSLEAFGKGNRKIYAQHSDAPFMTSQLGNIGMNSTILANEKTLAEYNRKGEEAFAYVIQNKDMLSGDALKLAEIYETAGRSLVDDSLEGMLTHEVGHRISYMTTINDKVNAIARGTDWEEYAKHLSGYANASFGEYFAESFSAYEKGETELLQPEVIKIFEGLKKK